MFKFLNKLNKVEVLSEISNFDERREIISQIIELQKSQGVELDPVLADSYFDWIFIRGDNQVNIAVAIGNFGVFSDLGVYELVKFASRGYKNSEMSLEDYYPTLSTVFAKAIELARASDNIDWLVQSVAGSFEIRASARAGFDSDIIHQDELKRVVESLRDKILRDNLLNGDVEQDADAFKRKCLYEIQRTIANRSSTFYKGREGKSVRRELRILRENKKLIEQDHPYYGLVMGMRTN